MAHGLLTHAAWPLAGIRRGAAAARAMRVRVAAAAVHMLPGGWAASAQHPLFKAELGCEGGAGGVAGGEAGQLPAPTLLQLIPVWSRFKLTARRAPSGAVERCGLEMQLQRAVRDAQNALEPGFQPSTPTQCSSSQLNGLEDAAGLQPSRGASGQAMQ